MKNIAFLLTTLLFVTACMQPREALKELKIGQFASPPETVTIRIKNYRPQAGNTLQNLFVSNFSVTASAGQLHWSTARDGMPDDMKLALQSNYGFLIDSPESTVFGFPDLLIYHAGIKLNQQSLLYCSPSLY